MQDKEILNLRERFLRYCAPPGTADALSRILLVGALMDDEDEKQLAPYDAMFASYALCALKKAGIAVSPFFDIEVANLLYGRDFLRDSFQADLVILCYVYNPFSREEASSSYMHFFPRLLTSEKHFDPGVWHDALMRCGAKVLAVFGDESEINEKHFHGPGFTLLQKKNEGITCSILVNDRFAASLPARDPDRGAARTVKGSSGFNCHL
ncbi:MAG: hypothetical protein HY370_06075 [Proteobacteria bacterium]|nr:hypothetical protein [Pseudomonadota bacterium]